VATLLITTLHHSSLNMASSPPRLAGKVAIVTASTDGIGLAIARRLAQDGAHVVISSRRQKNVDRALKELRQENLDVIGMVCHVANPQHRAQLIEQTLAEYGGIDILVSNAAANPAMGTMLDTTEAQWDKIFETNVKASFFLAKEVVPHIEKRGGGSVVFVSSIAGFQANPILGPYSVSKTALLGLVKAMAPQCAGMGIRVNGLAPGIVKTTFSQPLTANKEMEEMTLEKIPLGRLGVPDDMSGVVSFMVSEDAAYMTGENIIVTGGLPSRL
jgi:dehydrogenase/reductase SDR family protein 4